MNDEMAWEMEERLWLDGASAFEEALDPACLMAFLGMGVLGGRGLEAGAAPANPRQPISERAGFTFYPEALQAAGSGSGTQLLSVKDGVGCCH